MGGLVQWGEVRTETQKHCGRHIAYKCTCTYYYSILCYIVGVNQLNRQNFDGDDVWYCVSVPIWRVLCPWQMSTKNRNTIPPTVFPNNGTLSPPPDRSTSPMIIIIGLDTELQRKRAWFGFFFYFIIPFHSIETSYTSTDVPANKNIYRVKGRTAEYVYVYSAFQSFSIERVINFK